MHESSSIRVLAFIVLLTGIVLALPSSVRAQVTLYSEQAKLIRAPNAVTKLGPDLFGDRVNLYTGALEFVQNDVAIPGNSKLPVAVARRLVTGAEAQNNTLFGRWDLDIPHLHGIFVSGKGWLSTNNDDQRCKYYGAPPNVTVNNVAWSGVEYWHGSFIYVPGYGDQEMLKRGDYSSAPQNSFATYPIVTRGNWAIKCLDAMAAGNGATGQAFLAIAPDGTQYQFDWLVSRPVEPLLKNTTGPNDLVTTPPEFESPNQDVTASGASPESVNSIGSPVNPTPAASGTPQLNRIEVWILPTKVTDKFSNTVTYTYDTTNKWQLKSISGTDVAGSPRTITLSYVTPGSVSSNLVSSVSDGTRTWNYVYDNSTPNAQLQSVILPDGSSWSLGNAVNLLAGIDYAGPGACDDLGLVGSITRQGTMTHPSGAVGRFTLTPTRHGRSLVEKQCSNDPAGGQIIRFPKLFDTYALTKKELIGSTIGTLTWSTQFPVAEGSWSDCTSCSQTKVVTVTDPAGDSTAYTFGTAWRLTEGQLQQTEIISRTGSTLRSTTLQYATPIKPYGESKQPRGDGEMAARVVEISRRQVSQQNETFTWEASSFDEFARPKQVKKFSSLGYQKNETISYYDNTSKWVLGQIEKVKDTETGIVILENIYKADFATLTSANEFGNYLRTFEYSVDGTLYKIKDAKLQTTTLSDYKRGVPQKITYADGVIETAAINNIGNTDNIKDGNGLVTSFGYDSMGRLSRITYPAVDAAGNPESWNSTNLETSRSTQPKFDLPSSYWQQKVWTGTGYTVTYYDELLRPVYIEKYDSNEAENTKRIVKQRFDFEGRQVFQSHPKKDYSQTSLGTTTYYDALGRVTENLIDSEIGNLVTTNSYENGFSKRVTNARNFETTFRYQVFDTPTDTVIASILMAEGVDVRFDRDVFGKVKSITRSGGNLSVKRNYVYDTRQRLCKTVEPEVGATIQDYDENNNIAWRASGTDLSQTLTCDRTGIANKRKVNYTYDKRDRLSLTEFGDPTSTVATESILTTYTPDNLLATITSKDAKWTYTYNFRRLLKSESLVYGGTTYNIGRSYDLNGFQSSLTYPANSLTVGYSPNALGEPKQAGTYATNVTYHPNGAIAGFTYGNGIIRTMTQNARGLPLISKDTGILNDVYTYDANANVSGIDDAEAHISSRTMSYDGLDRLKTSSAPALWGSSSYSYDSQDNLIGATITSGSTARTTANTINPSTNRLDLVNSSNTSFNFSYNYDVQGNVVKRGPSTYFFNYGNRLMTAGASTYRYDGHGRRVSVVVNGGVNRVQVYSLDGQLLYITNGSSPATKLVYLHNHIVAEVK